MKIINQSDKTILVSIVIPVYNVAKYLKECVLSVLQQSYHNIEIIVVDDGSTDGSGEICDNLQADFVKLIVIHKKNGGLSDARNIGIKRATGQYICFVDSDDLVTQDYVESMMRYLDESVKISACGYCRYYDSGKKEKINFENINQYYKGIEAQKYLNIIGYFNVSACNKLFEKKLFDDISFPVGKKSEDWCVMYKLIEKAGGIYYNSDIRYYYRQRKGSITKSVIVNDGAIGAAKEVYDYYMDQDWKIAIPFAAQSLAFANIGVYNACLCEQKENKKQKMVKLRADTLIIRDRLTYSELSIIRRIQLFLFLNCKYVYDFLFLIYDLKRKLL